MAPQKANGPRTKRPKAKADVRSVYAELGYPNPDEMAIKAQLVTKIGDIIKRRKLTQKEAAGIMGMTQAKVSQMLRGQFRGISQAKLLACLAALGHNVEIRVKPLRRSKAAGSVNVVFAA
jgi:predicted XRE-type DNA-binding protein